jgi:hypothetical protein
MRCRLCDISCYLGSDILLPASYMALHGLDLCVNSRLAAVLLHLASTTGEHTQDGKLYT